MQSSFLNDLAGNKVISIKGIPVHLNKGVILRRYFSRFGDIRSVRCMPAKRSAYIHFETHEAARRAKLLGTQLQPGSPPLSLFWGACVGERLPRMSMPMRKSSKVLKQRSTFETPSNAQTSFAPSSVAEELENMGCSDDSFPGGYETIERPNVGSSTDEKETLTYPMGIAVSVPCSHVRSQAHSSHSEETFAANCLSPVKQARWTFYDADVDLKQQIIPSTPMGRVGMLEARDKLLRETLERRNAGRVSVGNFVGTCLDMCPEKERLYRQEVGQLSIYEILSQSVSEPGTQALVDHRRAVKEYSRSSADQEEPLAHELRPLSVLVLTMNYLLSEVVNWEGERMIGDWYDFMWNRLRSIRKDITQQRLCCPTAVSLLEKCARFHIYCSQRLCAEHLTVFDPKINDDNLTKCLQTLKEFYDDLAADDNHPLCPDEAHFRAYMVLMKLNEGDTLRQVQQLRLNVCNSEEIRFSVKAFFSLNSNNYVRFFRLVKSTSYLNACILYRYFNQIRSRALQVILQSHTPGMKIVYFPLAELARLLVFENIQDVKQFCLYYGLQTEANDVIFDRSNFVQPEAPLPFSRPFLLIDSKQVFSPGEVINGGRLQPVLLPQPQCSFDQQGNFILNMPDTECHGEEGKLESNSSTSSAECTVVHGETVNVDDQVPSCITDGPDTISNCGQQQLESVGQVRQSLGQYSNPAVKMVARYMFWEVIDEMVHTLATVVVHTCRFHNVLQMDVFNAIVSDVSSCFIRMIVESGQLNDNGHRIAHSTTTTTTDASAVNMVISSLIDVFLGDAVDSCLQWIAASVLQEAVVHKASEQMELNANWLQTVVLLEVCTEIVFNIATEMFQITVMARLRRLGDCCKNFELQRLFRYWMVWRKVFMVRQRQIQCMHDFPCMAFVPQNTDGRLHNMSETSSGSPLEQERQSSILSSHLTLASLVSDLRQMRVWQPLSPMSFICPERLKIGIVNCIYGLGGESDMVCKLLLSLPGRLELERCLSGSLLTPVTQMMSTLTEWLCIKLSYGKVSLHVTSDSERDILSCYSIQLQVSNTVTGQPEKVRFGLCVRKMPDATCLYNDMSPNEDERNDAKGATGILFLLPHIDLDDEMTWEKANRRLVSLLKAKPSLPPIPLVLLLPINAKYSQSAHNYSSVAFERFGIFDSSMVSTVALITLPMANCQPIDIAIMSPVLEQHLIEALKLAVLGAAGPLPNICGEPLVEVVEDMMNCHFFAPLLHNWSRQQEKGKLDQAPNVSIGLYNSLLDYVAELLTLPTLQDISWPIPELVSLWNNNRTEVADVAASSLNCVRVCSRLLAGCLLDVISVGPDPAWNTSQRLFDVYKLVTGLRLPWFHYENPYATDWTQACKDIWIYVHAVTGNQHPDQAVHLSSRVAFFLARVCVQFENNCNLLHNEDNCVPMYVNAPWTEIVAACAEFRLRHLHSSQGTDGQVCGDTVVYYIEHSDGMADFEPPISWQCAVQDTSEMVADPGEATLLDTMEQAAVWSTKEASMDRLHIDTKDRNQSNNLKNRESDLCISPITVIKGKLLDSPYADSASCLKSTSCFMDSLNPVLRSSHKLLLQVGQEQRSAQRFNDYLQHAMAFSDTPAVSITSMSPRPVMPTLSQLATTPFCMQDVALTGTGPIHAGMHKMDGDNCEDVFSADDSQTLLDHFVQWDDEVAADTSANKLFQMRLEFLLNS